MPARLLYLQEHYEFAIYKVQVDKPVQLPTFTECVRSGQDVFRLGRDESLNLSITHGMVAYNIPSWYERCHYMYLSCDPSSPSLVRYISIYALYFNLAILLLQIEIFVTTAMI